MSSPRKGPSRCAMSDQNEASKLIFMQAASVQSVTSEISRHSASDNQKGDGVQYDLCEAES